MFAQTDLAKLANEVGAHAGSICPMLIGFFLFILAMGIVLRTACSLFNSIVGGKDAAEGVPMPSLLGCMFLVLISYIVGIVLAGAVVWTATSMAIVTNLSGPQAAYYAGMARIPIGFLVLTILLLLFGLFLWWVGFLFSFFSFFSPTSVFFRGGVGGPPGI